MDLHIHIPLWVFWCLPALYIAVGCWFAYIAAHWPFARGDQPRDRWRAWALIVTWPKILLP